MRYDVIVATYEQLQPLVVITPHFGLSSIAEHQDRPDMPRNFKQPNFYDHPSVYL